MCVKFAQEENCQKTRGPRHGRHFDFAVDPVRALDLRLLGFNRSARTARKSTGGKRKAANTGDVSNNSDVCVSECTAA
jgi:hypothetical protein